MKTVVYRRHFNSDTWHFMPECQHWPKKPDRFVEMIFEGKDRPAGGELCDQCRSLEKHASEVR